MQRSIRQIHEPIHAHITIPGSRSITHRALLLAALAGNVSEISGLQLGKQTLILINALHQLGIVAQLDKKSRTCIIAGGNGKFPKKQATIWCGNAKSITQFLIAACAPSPGVYYFDGSTDLARLPLTELVRILCRQGAQVIPNDAKQLPLTLIGSDTLEGGEILLDEYSHTQLVSALLMITPFARSPFNFNNLGLAHQQLIDMTCAMMAEFGVLVHRIHQGQFIVPVPQRYQARDYVVEPDMSIAAYFFAAAALTQGEITIQPIKRLTIKQADVNVLSALENMGCQVWETHKGLTVKGPVQLQGTLINLPDFPHSFLALAALAPFAKSPTHIINIHQLPPNSANKLSHFIDELTKMNIHIETNEQGITIFPGTPQGRLVNTHHHADIAMAFSLLGLKCSGVILNDAHCVARKYADFFKYWDQLSQPDYASP